MYEYILARLPLDEPKAFAGIEPLDCSLFFHFYFLLSIELFVFLPIRVTAGRASCLCRKKKGRKSVKLAAALDESKGFHKSNKRNPILPG
jgi:hypothetical protein